MANKRMFSMNILDSDAFLDMPLSSQCLYFHLNMRADDDGFIGNPKRIQKLIGASEDDLKLLLAKRFILAFENGVIVIKHWKMHNTIRFDRYTPTKYQEELSMMVVKKNNSYTLDNGNQMATKWQPNGNPVLGLDIDSDIDKDKEINIVFDFFKNYSNGNQLLYQSLKDFEKMRKSIKKPLTDRAKTMLLAELDKLATDGENITECLNQSIFHSWQGVFPIKKGAKDAQSKSNTSTKRDSKLEGVIEL